MRIRELLAVESIDLECKSCKQKRSPRSRSGSDGEKW